MKRQRENKDIQVMQYFKNKYETRRHWGLIVLGGILLLFGFSMLFGPYPELFVFGVLFAIVGAFVVVINSQRSREQTHGITSEYLIYSLRDNTRMSGSFLLGIGAVDSSDNYVFYRQGDHGGVKRDTLECEDV